MHSRPYIAQVGGRPDGRIVTTEHCKSTCDSALRLTGSTWLPGMSPGPAFSFFCAHHSGEHVTARLALCSRSAALTVSRLGRLLASEFYGIGMATAGNLGTKTFT